MVRRQGDENMSEICKNRTQWLKLNRFANQAPEQSSLKEMFSKYFDEAAVEKYIQEVQGYLSGRKISLKTNTVFINAVK